jgi:uncharacterized protein YjbI with pentapeptide repeats
MRLSNVSATSSTLAHADFDHCAFIGDNFFNSLFALSRLDGVTLDYCNLDGALVQRSSLRGLRIDDCNVDGLLIDGVDVGALLKTLKSNREATNGS